MTVAVVGGTGTLGSLVVAELLGRGEQVAVLSRRGAGVPAGAEHRRVDLRTGDGLDRALEGVGAVVDAANSQKGAKETLVDGTRRLAEAGARAGVANHVTISIVGIDRVPIAYYKTKLAQEEALAAGEAPWTLLRATQFHQLVDAAVAAAARFGVRPTGRVKVQPVDPRIVAARLADAALAPPAGRLPDVGGPRIQTLTELSEAWASARGRRRLPLRVPAWGKIGRSLAAGGLCDEEAATPGEDFEEWLRHG
ncbi:MAG TPA: NAD(P)H-binding protein [Solirubrobacterales bacterium]|nr:NAD(P)H-binding protein [Solirubrobacterales bacterium]